MHIANQMLENCPEGIYGVSMLSFGPQDLCERNMRRLTCNQAAQVHAFNGSVQSSL